MSETCLRCGTAITGDPEPWGEPVRRSFEAGFRHYECELRRKWQEWKEIIAEMNDIGVSDVSFTGESGKTTADEGGE